MKSHTPPTPFHSLRVEKRLALGLLAQPQNKNRRRTQDNDSDTALTITAFATLVMFFFPIIYFLYKR